MYNYFYIVKCVCFPSWIIEDLECQICVNLTFALVIRETIDLISDRKTHWNSDLFHGPVYTVHDFRVKEINLGNVETFALWLNTDIQVTVLIKNKNSSDVERKENSWGTRWLEIDRIIRRKVTGTGQTAQLWKGWTALAEDPSLGLRALIRQLTAASNSSSRRLTPPASVSICTHTCAHTSGCMHIHTLFKNVF